MNMKRFVFAVIALFLFIFGYESIVHGMLLKGTYLQTPTIWRSYDQMMTYIPLNIVIQMLISLWATYIFTRLFKEGGWRNGLRFGLFFGVLSGIQAAGAYYYLPISAPLAGYWFIVYLLESLLGGFLIGLIYQRAPSK